jgi:hypothetical protein
VSAEPIPAARSASPAPPASVAPRRRRRAGWAFALAALLAAGGLFWAAQPRLDPELDALPLLRLHLSQKDRAHLLRLYDRLEDPHHGLETYGRENVWRGARLTWDGETHPIQFKAHGRTPAKHRAGDDVSLSIRLTDGQSILGARRFNLIVFHRIVSGTGVMEALAQELELIAQRGRFCRVQVGDEGPTLFVLEHRFNPDYFETTGRPTFLLLRPEMRKGHNRIGCAIYPATGAAPDRLREELDQALGASKLPVEHHAGIRRRYEQVNRAMLDRDPEAFVALFDVDHLARFEAARALLGGVSHGLDIGNLRVFLDRASGRFYPAVHRDILYAPLDQKLPLEEQLARVCGEPAAFFALMSRSDRVRQAKYRILHDVATDPERRRRLLEGLGRALTTAVRLREALERSPYRAGLMRLGAAEANLAAFERHLARAEPQVAIGAAPGRVTLELRPGAMAPLRVSGVRVRLGDGRLAGPASAVWTWREVGAEAEGPRKRGAAGPRALEPRGGHLDLTPLLDGLRAFDGVGPEGVTAPRAYVVRFDLPGLQVGADAVEVELTHELSGRVVAWEPLEGLAPVLSGSGPEPLAPPEGLGWRWEGAAPLPRSEGGPPRGAALRLPAGEHSLGRDLVLPEGVDLILSAGARLKLGPGVSLVVRGNLRAEGTASEPVVVEGSDPARTFGALAAIGRGDGLCDLQHLRLRGGEGDVVDGAVLMGGLTLLHPGEARIRHCEVSGGRGEDGLNVQYARVVLEDSRFSGGRGDQVDLDLCQGTVVRCRFEGEGVVDGDGLDVSGARLVVRECLAEGNGDKGLSVGEASDVLVVGGRAAGNGIGVAVKDASRVYLSGMDLAGNQTDLAAYQKKPIFDGGVVYLRETQPATRQVDARSRVHALPAGARDPAGVAPAELPQLLLQPSAGLPPADRADALEPLGLRLIPWPR